MPNPLHLLGLAFAGAAGTLARYGLTVLVDSRWAFGGTRLYGTFIVNALGCLLFGLVLAWFDTRMMKVDHPMRLIVFTGFMGAFTTFSTYALLSSNLIHKQQWWATGGYILAHNIVGIGLFILGITVGSRLAS